MTADVTESGQEGGAEEQPSPQPSPNADSQSTSSVDVKAFAEALMPFIKEEISKGTQSTKDKRIQKLTNQMDGFESQLAEFNDLVGKGLSETDALWRMKVESQLKMNAAPPEETIGNQSTPTASVETQAILKQLGLDENNPEVTKVLRESKDLAAQLASFINLSTSQKQTEPNPAAVQPSGGGKTSYESVDAVVERLDVLYRHPSAHKEEIDKLVLRLIELEPKVQ